MANGNPVLPLRQHLDCSKMPGDHQAMAKPFLDLAKDVDRRLDDSYTKADCIKKLLEAKDCAIRAYEEERARDCDD